MKSMKRMIAMLLVVLILVGILPIGALADYVVNSDEVRQALAEAVTDEEYPQGMFDFLTAKMEISEDMTFGEFAVVRCGNTDSAASVQFKAVDMSAEYGVDYTIELENGLNDIEIGKNEDAPVLLTELIISQDEVGVLDVEAYEAALSGEGVPEAEAETGSEAEAETEAAAAGDDRMTLQQAVKQATGHDMDAYDWQEDDQETLAAFQEASLEMYDDIPGHEIVLRFEPGEYQKILRFNVIDDDLSEDDEQVLFILSHAENCALSENPTGYMNIRDNEPADEAYYYFSQDRYTVAPDVSEVTVELRRQGAESRTTTVTLMTAGDTAVGETDYTPMEQELVFMPGQVAASLTVPILHTPETEMLTFSVRTEDASAFTEVALLPRNSAAPSVSAAGEKSLALMAASLPSYSVTYDLSSILSSVSTGTHYNGNAFIATPGSSAYYTAKTGSAPDLTMAQAVSFTYSTDGSGTKHTKGSGCSKSTYYSKDRELKLDISGCTVFNKTVNDSMSNTSHNSSLPSGARKKMTSLGWYCNGKNNCSSGVSGYLARGITVYYEPFFVDVGGSNSDTKISPMVYSSANAEPENQKVTTPGGQQVNYTFEAGTMRAVDSNGKDYNNMKIYFNDMTIRFEPVFDAGLTAEQRDGIFLWGIKLEKVSSGRDPEYYYLDKTEINLRSLYTGQYKDFYTGKTIDSQCLLTSGSLRGYKVYPVYRQKPAYTAIKLPAELKLEDSTFPSVTKADKTTLPGNVIVTGRLDQIKLNAVPASGDASKVAAGWTGYEFQPTGGTGGYTDPGAYVDARLKSENAATYNSRLEKQTGYVASTYNYASTWNGTQTRSQYNFGTAVPGTLTYTPKARWNVLVASSMTPTINVTVYPQADSDELQKYGIVAYVDVDSQTAQSAQYTGTATIKDANGNPLRDENGNIAEFAVGTSINISPYELKAYSLIGSLVAEKEAELAKKFPGMKFKFYWKDWTGDSNGDGKIDTAEYRAMGEDIQNLYGSARLTYVGTPMNYVPKIIGDSVLYYELVGVAEGSAAANSLYGWVKLRGNTVIANSGGSTETTKLPLKGVRVQVGELTTTTDEDGFWRITDSSFGGSEIYSVSFTYNGRVYSDSVSTNNMHETYIDEYNTFNVTDFTVGDTKNPIKLELKDKTQTYALKVDPTFGGIEPSGVVFTICHKDGTTLCDIDAVKSDDYRIWKAEFNPISKGVVAGDYLEVTVYGQDGIPYPTHKIGFSYQSSLRMVNVVNNFLSPITSPVYDFFGSVDMAFNLGMSAVLEDGEESGLKAAGFKMTNNEDNTVKTVSWGWNTNFSSTYKPKDKKGDGEKAGANSDHVEEAKDSVREAASSLEEEDGEVSAPSELDDEEKDNLSEVESVASDAVDSSDKGKKNRSSFAAGIKIDISIATSIEMAYDTDAEKWYFVEFLVVGKVAPNASAAYSYMTPIGVKLSIKAELSGDITAIFGYSPYYKNAGAPDYRYIGEGDSGGVFDMLTAKSGNSDINREYNVYGRLIVRPTVSLSIGAALLSDNLAKVTLTGSAAFDMVFTSAQTGKGSVTLSAKLELKLIGGLITKKWTLAQETFNMFEYNSRMLLMKGQGDARYEEVTASDVGLVGFTATPAKQSSTTGGGSPIGGGTFQATGRTKDYTLLTGLNYDADPVIERMCSNSESDSAPRSILVFLRPNESGRLVLMYSVLTGGEWSDPVQLDPDSKGDDTPNITWLEEGKLIISWTTFVGEDGETDPEKLLNQRRLRTRFVTYDETGYELGDIRVLTRAEDAYGSGDSDASFAYFNSDGKKTLLAVYRKNVYSPSDDTMLVGDVLNPASTFAVRIYDFENDDWADSYGEPRYASVLSKDTAAALYGQYFLDFYHYGHVKNSEKLMTADEIKTAEEPIVDSRGGGVWKETPNAEDVEIVELSDESRITEMVAAGCSYDVDGAVHELAVMTYVVDLDGSDNTPDDSEIFVKIFDLTAMQDYLAFPLTRNAVAENNLIITDANGGLRLHYISDGSVVCTNLSDIMDNIEFGELEETDIYGDRYVYFLENRLPDYIVPETVQLARTVASGGNTDEKYYSDFSMDWDDTYEILLYSESGISYAGTLSATDSVAALPDYHYVERQLYAITNVIEESSVTDESGNQYVGYVDNWQPSVQVTSDKGLNFLSFDCVFTANEISVVGVQAYSKVQEVGGTRMAVPDTNNCKLVAATYDLQSGRFGNVRYNIALTNADEISCADRSKPFPVELLVTNINFRSAEAPQVYLSLRMKDETLTPLKILCEDDSGQTVEKDSFTLSEYAPYETRSETLYVMLPEDLSDVDGIQAELRSEDNSPFSVWSFGTDMALFEQPASLTITGMERTLSDRSHASYQLTVHNSATVELNGQAVTVTVGDASTDVGSFTVAPLGDAEVTVTAELPDSAFTEARENGMITETVKILLAVNGDSIEDTVTRSGLEAWEEKVQSAVLTDEISGKLLTSSIVMEPGDYMVVSAAAPDGTMLLAQPVSENSKVASVDYIGGISAKANGTTTMTVQVMPMAVGSTALNELNQFRQFNDLDYLPSALVREIELPVYVSSADYTESAITVPVNGDKDSVKVQATISGSTATVKEISDSELEKVTGGEDVEIDLSGLSRKIDTAKLPTTTVEKIGEQGGMSVKLTTATVEFDKTATREIADQANGSNVELVVDDIKEVSLNAAQKKAVSELDTALIIDAHLVSNGKRLCTESSGGFGGGTATVILPYELRSGSTAANYTVFYVAEDGTLEKMNAKYDTALKAFVFEIGHFSIYAVAYDENIMPFVDVPEGEYYYDAVKWAAANAITSGTDATHFSPDLGTTRAQVVTFLWRTAGCPEPKGDASKFTDLVSDEYYVKAVAWAIEQGVTKGTSETTFSPDAVCTRGQIVTFLARFAGVKDADTESVFTDVKATDYFAAAVKWAKDNKVTEGTSATTFSPNADCTRAQIVTFLYRWMVK